MNFSSTTGVVIDCVLAHIQGLLEERLRGHGVGLRELALFVATLLPLGLVVEPKVSIKS